MSIKPIETIYTAGERSLIRNGNPFKTKVSFYSPDGAEMVTDE